MPRFLRVPDHPVDVMVVEGDQVFRRGLIACLQAASGIGFVEAVDGPAEAWAHPALAEAHVLLLDASVDSAPGFAADLLEFTVTRVVALVARGDGGRVAEVVGAGAVGTLDREGLTEAGLLGMVRAVAAGTPALVAVPDDGGAPCEELPPGLSEREQQVLALVADGLRTREIGDQLHFSERTVKKVLGDVTTKLGARSRSEAVARAVRAGLI